MRREYEAVAELLEMEAALATGDREASCSRSWRACSMTSSSTMPAPWPRTVRVLGVSVREIRAAEAIERTEVKREESERTSRRSISARRRARTIRRSRAAPRERRRDRLPLRSPRARGAAREAKKDEEESSGPKSRRKNKRRRKRRPRRGKIRGATCSRRSSVFSATRSLPIRRTAAQRSSSSASWKRGAIRGAGGGARLVRHRGGGKGREGRGALPGSRASSRRSSPRKIAPSALTRRSSICRPVIPRRPVALVDHFTEGEMWITPCRSTSGRSRAEASGQGRRSASSSRWRW